MEQHKKQKLMVQELKQEMKQAELEEVEQEVEREVKQVSLQTLICTPVRFKIACLLGLPFDYQLERCTELLRVITTSQTWVSLFFDMGTYCFYRSVSSSKEKNLFIYNKT